jgi:hypothetical protein
MIEIVIPKKIRVGGLNYNIEVNDATAKEMESSSLYGQCSGTLQRIRLWSRATPQKVSGTFIHEVLHAIDDVYDNSEITEKQNTVLANGLLQIMEQLGIRFVIRESK